MERKYYLKMMETWVTGLLLSIAAMVTLLLNTLTFAVVDGELRVAAAAAAE